MMKPFLSAALFLLATASSTPKFPTSFTTRVEITSNLLPVDGPSYPPRTRTIYLSYSAPLQAVKAEITAGYESGKTYLRQYSDKMEYMIKSGEFGKCQRSNLLEDFSLPHLPHLVEVGEELIDAVPHVHYVHDIAGGIERVHIYFNKENGNPRRLVHDDIEKDQKHGGEIVTTLMTYDLHDFQLVGDDTQTEFGNIFDIPGEYQNDPSKCERFVGGWGYIHVFHSYLKV